jgi:hypothetical protein
VVIADTPTATATHAEATPTPSGTQTDLAEDTPTPTPTPDDPVIAALDAALRPLCNTSGILGHFEVGGGGDLFVMNCVASAGHDTQASLSGLASAEEAEGDFELRSGDPCFQMGEFQGLPLATCSTPFQSGRTETWVWRSGCWVTEITAADDTDVLLAPLPADVAAAIAAAGAGPGVFATCPGGPDLVVSVVDFGVDLSSCRGPFERLVVCVRNVGGRPAGPFRVAINGGADAFVVAEGLAVGQSRCDYRPPIAQEVTAAVDADNDVAESDEDNNTRTEFVGQPTVPATCEVDPVPTPTPPPAEASDAAPEM